MASHTVRIIPYGELGIIPYGSATILHPHHTYRSTSGTTVTYVFTYYCMLYVHVSYRMCAFSEFRVPSVSVVAYDEDILASFTAATNPRRSDSESN